MKKQPNNTSLSVIYWVKIGGMTTRMYRTYVWQNRNVLSVIFQLSNKNIYCGGWSCFFCRTWAAIRSRSLRPWTVNLRPPSPVFSISFSCSRDCNALRATPPAPLQKCDGHTPFRWRPAMTMFTSYHFLTSIQYLIKGKVCKATHSLHTPFLQTLLLLFRHTQNTILSSIRSNYIFTYKLQWLKVHIILGLQRNITNKQNLNVGLV